MKLLTWETQAGKKGFCGAKCYNSKKKVKRSRCICKGENSGVGEEQAIKNTQHYYRKWVQEKENKEHTTLLYTLAPICKYIQMELWQ